MQSAYRRWSFAITLLTLSALARPAAAFNGLLQLGYSFGGDSVATVYYTDGTSEDARVNMGMNFTGGVGFGSRDAGDFQGQLLGGYMIGGAGASNGGVDWSTFHVDLLGLYNVNDNLRLGAGITQHMSPEIESTGDLSGIHYEYDDALGYIAVIEYDMRALLFGMHYTMIDYTLKAINGYDVSAADLSDNGDSVSLYMGLRW